MSMAVSAPVPIRAPIRIRPAVFADAEAISTLILPLVERFIAPDLTQAGAHLLTESMQLAAIRSYLTGDYRYWLALDAQDAVLGAVALKGASHLYHLFVSTEAQRAGVATALWCHARTEATMQAQAAGAPLVCFTVNSSLYAADFYRRLGFVPLSGPRERMGVVDIPMQLNLSD